MAAGGGRLSDFIDFFAETVTIEPYTGATSAKGAAYGTAVTYAARIEMRNHIVKDKSGKDVVARGRVYLGTATVPDVRDRLTLPTRFTPTQPPIIDVNSEPDENGNVHHVKLEIG